MAAPTILVVEDDPQLRTLIARALQGNGFVVRTASGAAEMWGFLDADIVDLVVLDIMLPGPNGIDLCREIRRKRDTPIIFASAKGSETDRIVGLELGADDYLPKPFSTEELVARVRAVLRRTAPTDQGAGRSAEAIRFDGWTVDLPRRELRSARGAIVDLTGAEFDLLVTLLEHPQRIVARERLLELTRSRNEETSDRSIDVLVSRIRRKLSTSDKPAPILTIRGVGYMLNVPVERG
ncbi:response regulator [Sphingomonas sp. ac-8]|uniref:response regulator n=1 Tax=Sphingomonas sp. ac-8 TaxID=3242977 RepID=UPI003A805629